MAQVLIVDDDPGVRDLLGMYLRAAGYEVTLAECGLAALDAVRSQAPNLVVLDVMLPDLDGFEVCRRLNAVSPVPVIFLTCRDDALDIIVGLEVGADDYVTKPFNPREVVARVKAVLRRIDPPAAQTRRLAVGTLSIDSDTREVTVGDTAVHLTRKEFDILRLLAGNPRVVFTREQVMQQVWGGDYEYQDVRTVDTHVKRVRRKLTDAGCFNCTIEAVWGTGYRFVSTA